MSLRAGALLCPLFALAAVALACGDDGGPPPGRTITAADLQEIVLQDDDVDVGVLQEPIIQGDDHTQAYGHQFEVPPDEASPGETVCVIAAVARYNSIGDAEDAFNSVRSQINEQIQPGNPALRYTDVPAIGDESLAFTTTLDSTNFCSSYTAQPLNAFTIYFRDRDILVRVVVNNLESGASREDAINLAYSQLERIQEFRDSEAQ